MPLYDYKCEKCEHQFEEVRSIADRERARCPECGSKIRILLGAPGLSLFKPGWWRDLDYHPQYIETPQQLRNALDKAGSIAPSLENSVHKTSDEGYDDRRREAEASRGTGRA